MPLTRVVTYLVAAALVFAAGFFFAARDRAPKSDARADASAAGLGAALPAATVPDVAATAAFAVASPLDTQGATRKPASDGMQEVEIMDLKGFGQPMVAAIARIPADWVTRGGVTWDRSTQCAGNMMRMGWAASSADGLHGFEIRPGFNWQVQGTEIKLHPCAPMPVQSTRDYLVMVVHQRHADRARILQYRERPDLVAAPQNPSQGANQARQEGGQMLIGYEINGQEFRESLITTVTFTQVQGNVVGGTPFVFAQHAPDGKLDMDLGERLRESIKQGRQWTQTYQNDILQAIDRISAEQSRGITKWHNDQMTAISLKGANDRSQIRTQTQREISEIYSSTWKTTQDTSDRMHRRSLETIGEYNTFRDPATNAPVRATIHNNHVWRVGYGRYVSTNDPNFAPANGVQLNRIP